MREFSIANAWRMGIRFVADQAMKQAIVLIGIGVLLPLLLQLGIFWFVPEIFEPAATREAPAEAGSSELTVIVTFVIAWSLPIVSYFAAFRLGSSRGVTLSRALAFGFVAALLAIVALAVLIGMAAYGMSQLLEALAVLAVLLVIFLFFTILFTTMAAMMLVTFSLVLALTMIAGIATGDMGLAATLFGGGSGFIVVIFIVICGVLLWLGGRFSCTTALMTERRSFNLFAAMAESWRITWDDEWRILRYLALVGLVLAVMLVLAFFITGAGLIASQAAAFSGGEPTAPVQMASIAILQFVFGIPLAYLSVMVPAGIHRELMGSPVEAEIFA